MKKLILASACLFCLYVTHAQGFKIGAKVGSNITGLTGLQFKQGFEYGYHLGLFSELSLSKSIGFQPELLWSQTNLTSATNLSVLYQPSLGNLQDIRLTYLSIPLLLSIKPFKRLTFQVGPQFGVLIDNTKPFSANATGAFKNGDFSMMAGAQIKLVGLRLYGRYGIGLTNINDIQEQDKWRSKTLQLGVGIAL
jgi:hypothetical protein